MANKKAVKKEVKKEVVKKWKITKRNGRVIYRTGLGAYADVYKRKGCKVEEV